jgi:hypothetical protein
MLSDLYVRNGVEFTAAGVELHDEARRGLVIPAASVVRFEGTVGGRTYRGEVRDGRVTGVWKRVIEGFGQRGQVIYWVPVLGPERPRRAGRRLRTVLEEAEALIVAQEAANAPRTPLAPVEAAPMDQSL